VIQTIQTAKLCCAHIGCGFFNSKFKIQKAKFKEKQDSKLKEKQNSKLNWQELRFRHTF